MGTRWKNVQTVFRLPLDATDQPVDDLTEQARHPLDFMRRVLTKGLEVDAGDRTVSRGDTVDAVVTISKRGGVAKLEVGLLCTEYYDLENTYTSTDRDGQSTTQTSRERNEAVVYESWLPAPGSDAVQTIRFTIPPGAPFSYDGDCLSFEWELVARGRKRHMLDAQARQAISVSP